MNVSSFNVLFSEAWTLVLDENNKTMENIKPLTFVGYCKDMKEYILFYLNYKYVLIQRFVHFNECFSALVLE
jgi:hypothetical protein